MLDVEAALAESQAACGMVPNECGAPIRAAAEVDLYDCDALIDELANAGAPAVPVVKALTVEVARTDPKAAKFVHWGGTTQDVTDTALVLQLRQAVPMVIGRLDDMVGVGGVNVFPTASGAVVSEFAEFSGEYRIVLDGSGPYHRLPLEVELQPGQAGTARLAETLAASIRKRLQVTAHVSLCPAQSLPRTEGKTRRVIRNAAHVVTDVG